MADASYAQTSFLGGELSKWAQGQFDTPRYKKGLNKAQNVLLVDEGAAPRRPGFQFLGTSRNGAPGRLIPFDFAEDSPYNMEFTDGFLRFWNESALVTTNDSQIISSISNSTPAIFSLSAAVTWATGDQVYFTFDSPFQAVAGAALLERQFTLTVLSPITFSIVDSITGAPINGSVFNATNVGIYTGPLGAGPISNLAFSGSASGTASFITLSMTVNHIAQITTPYTVAGNDWHSIRAVQGLELSVLLHTSVAPQALEVLALPSENTFATFSYNKAFFQDGPYLDPPANAIATPSGLSGSIQVTVGYPAWVSTTVYGQGVQVTYSGQDYVSLGNNNTGQAPSSSPLSWGALFAGQSVSPQGFVSTDVGRVMRLFSAPQNWLSTATYASGVTVTYNGSYFTSLINSNTDNAPDISLSDWVINPSGAVYTWGVITQLLASNTVQLQLYGTNLLYTTPCPNFQLGAWSDTTGWPTCGCYQGGRFWYGGAIRNRVDSSQPDAPFVMSPTNPDGTVTDSCGISYTFNSNSADKIVWMEPQPTGILIGTKKGEYLLSSGTGNGPITPSSIADSPATKYGSSDVLPVKTGLSMCFVQKYGRRLLEYLADVFSQRFYGPDLTTFVRHIGKRQFRELAYQQEPAPIVWGRMGDGSLVGTTYRRVSLFSNQEPEFNAWHQHPLGSGRLVESICVGPVDEQLEDQVIEGGDDNSLDTLSMITNDTTTNIRFVESLTPLLDEDDPLTSSWFLDAAVVPGAASIVSYSTNGGALQNYVRFYGLAHLNTRQVSVFAAALDCGDYFVENGQLDVPMGVLDIISGYTFDIPQFDILQPLADTFSNLAVSVVSGSNIYSIPCVIGFNYQTQGQLCRPMLQADSGARNGPGFAKKSRTARYGIHLVNSLGVQVGASFDKTFPVPTVSPRGNPLPYLSSFTGTKREILGDDFSFNSMVCWQTVRPYPATIVNLGGFIATEDV